jgi:hypothetical protein
VTTHRKALPAMADLQDIKLRLEASHNLHPVGSRSRVSMSPEDCDYLIELIDAIIADRDVREKYWRTLRGAPEKDWRKKMEALWTIAVNTTPDNPPNDEFFERIAADTSLTFDVVKHAYRKHLLPRRVAIIKKREGTQSDK